MAIKVLADRFVVDPRWETRSGGMGEVRKAQDMKESRTVAIKFFKEDFASDKYTSEAFTRESRNLQALDHPNIVRVIDGGVDPDGRRRYLVLEWLPETLESRLATGAIQGWDDFYEVIGRPVLRALEHAYAREIIHRDLKPANILFAEDGSLRVTDFGISKFKGAPPIGITLAGYRTEPFAPPERDSGAYSDTRDVFSFAVLAISCLWDRKVSSYDEVYRGIKDLNVPPAVSEVLEACLDQLPENRIANVVDLFARLEKIHKSREKAWAETPRWYVRLTERASLDMQKLRPIGSVADVSQLITDDLNEICAFRMSQESLPNRPDGGPSDRLTVIGSRFRYRAGFDEAGDHIFVAGIDRPPSSILDQLRADAFTPAMEVKIGRPPVSDDARATIVWLAEAIADHEATQAERRFLDRRERIFKEWEQLLNARDAVERSQRKSLRFNGTQVRGNRVFVTLEDTAPEQIVGQPWMIRSESFAVVSGEIESATDESVVLWVESGIEGDVPNKGTLAFDTRASQKALQKQRAALDAIRFERCVRPELKALLADPSQSQPPEAQTVAEFHQNELDDDKRRIVAAALGTHDFLFVEGPPGTGKTRFIAELILQLLDRRPSPRILLTSQTHVALDNALERVERLDSSAKLVRVGRRNDPRIAKSVDSLLLENRANEWLKEVQKKSASFVSGWALRHNVDSDEVRLGMAVSRLRLALNQASANRGKLDAEEAELETINDALARKDVTGDDTEYSVLKERARQLEESIAQARYENVRAQARLKEARQTVTESSDLGPELAKQDAKDLAAWEADLLGRDDLSRQCKAIIELAEEWELRFGKSSDFHAALLSDSNVVAGTCVGFMSPKGVQEIEFDVCIVDEASKANVNELLVPLSRARTWIMVGDRRQLPPFADGSMDARLLDEYGLDKASATRTLLDYLGDALPSECYAMLTEQHRMRPEIGSLISNCFYEGKLRSRREVTRYQLEHAVVKPVTWLSTSGLPSPGETAAKPSFTNISEVKQCIALLKRIEWVAKVRKTRYSVVVLTGYGAQRTELERAVAKVKSDLTCLDVAVHTVDAFQGREADVAIYSVTRSNDQGTAGFLTERRRLNVALSRAREALVIVGDHGFCSSIKATNPFIDVLQHIASNPAECALEVATDDA